MLLLLQLPPLIGRQRPKLKLHKRRPRRSSSVCLSWGMGRNKYEFFPPSLSGLASCAAAVHCPAVAMVAIQKLESIPPYRSSNTKTTYAQNLLAGNDVMVCCVRFYPTAL